MSNIDAQKAALAMAATDADGKLHRSGPWWYPLHRETAEGATSRTVADCVKRGWMKVTARSVDLGDKAITVQITPAGAKEALRS